MSRIGFRVNTEASETEDRIIVPCDYQHAVCIGATGTGKTVSIILPTMQDRINMSHALIVYLYKGHEDKKIKQMAYEAGRLQDVIEIGKPHGSYINLLSMLDNEAIKKVFISLLGGPTNANIDPYWSTAAARVGATMVEIIRYMNKIQQLFDQYTQDKIILNSVSLTIEKDDKKKIINYTYPEDELSFKSLLTVTNNLESVQYFFEGLAQYIIDVKKKLYNEIYQTEPDRKNVTFAKQVTKEIYRLDEIITTYGTFSVSTDSGENGGNNGVLQILNNALIGVANKEYINSAESDLLKAIEDNAIVIIDIEGLGKDIHGALLESLLTKLASRVRNGTPSPVSIFIDEANRVLSNGMDIHNDVLRESNVELILAIQNEEQMINKFGSVGWSSIQKNFKHTYMIELDHTVTYNNEVAQTVIPLLFNEETLTESEYRYNAQPHVQNILYDKFDMNHSLPSRFSIQYSIVVFETENIINLISEEHEINSLEYMGKSLKEKLNKQMQKLGFPQTGIQRRITF